jgi:hypothetical protein
MELDSACSSRRHGWTHAPEKTLRKENRSNSKLAQQASQESFCPKP